MKIVVDAFGGDYAPEEIVLGCINAIKNNNSIEIVLVGDKDRLNQIIEEKMFVSENLQIVHAPDVITNEDDVSVAVKNKKTSSLVVAYEYLKKNKDAVAIISASSIDAMMMLSGIKLTKIKGASTLALAPLLPTVNDSHVMLLDCSENFDLKPANLLQFALMANEFMKSIGVKKPKIALLNSSVSNEKGNELTKATYNLLEKSKLNFVGNIESRDIMRGSVDVIVCDGFSGNLCLKTIEGAAEILFGEMKELLTKNLKTKIGGRLIKKDLMSLKYKYDYRKVGGAPILGADKIVIKCHGNSKADSIEKAINQAYKLTKNKVIENISKVLNKNEKK